MAGGNDDAAEGATAFADRVNSLGALTDQERKTAAYNVLANTYGVGVAGDPDTALKAQEYGQRQQTNPIAVQQAQANLTGTTQENDYNALANPIKLTGLNLENQKTSAQTADVNSETHERDTLLPGQVAQQGATLNQTRAQTGLIGAETAHTNVETAAGRLSLNTQQAAQDRQSAMGLLAALSDTASNGGDVGGKFDQLAPLIAKYEGVDPSHLAPLRSALVQDPVGTINKLSEGINAAQMMAMGGTGKTGGSAAALKMLQFGQQQMSLKDGLNYVQQRTAAVPSLTDQMAALVPQLSSVAIVRKAKAEIPGTPEYQFNQLVEQLKPNLALDDIRTLRSTGTSMGRVTNAEMGMAANAMGNMDLGQNPSVLAANLNRIKGTYANVNADLANQIKSVGNGPMSGQMAHQPNFVTGQVYQDAQGRKAQWTGKSWKPVP